MCGIAGFTGAPDLALLKRMTELMKLRGPDYVGYYEDKNSGVSLGHARLSVLDDAGGVQPMWNEDFSVCIVFNGEIYNHEELRLQLVIKGHIFKSNHSDTEVLVHGYEEWGTDLLEKLNGMFAFCIYDKAKNILFFGRDRFGEKPLYYSLNQRGIIFSSDLRAVLLHPNVDHTIDPISVKKYFAYGYIPAPHSLYKNTYKLPGGCGLIYHISTKEAKKFTYWQFRIEVDESYSRRTEADLADELMTTLTQATKLRMLADVPVGIFLSGGVDSSSIVACASRLGSIDHIKTFSIGFSENQFNEAEYARIVAKKFKTEHFEKYIELSTAKSLYHDILNQLDEPMADSSIVPTYLLAQFAREHVTVALGGDGADELFAGYAPFKILNVADRYIRFFPNKMRKFIKRSVDRLPATEGYLSLDYKIKRTLHGLEQSKNAWNPAWLGPLSPDDIGDLMSQKCTPEEIYAEAIDAWESSKAPDDIGKTSEFYAKFYLQDGILTKIDRASMMVSLEVRSPFLDNNVVNFARHLPSKYKVKNGISKYLLKRSMRGYLPDEILDRTKKGFAMPLTKWLKEWVIDVHELPGLDANFVRRSISRHKKGAIDNRLFIWSWMVLQKFIFTKA